MTEITKSKLSLIGLGICILSTLFYVYDFIIRVIPGTISQTIIQKYHLSAGNFGLLSSFFFLGYVVMQLPCGLLYDRFGPRLVMTVTLFIASIATYLFISTDSFAISATARFFMGLGAAFAYIGALVLVSRWLPSKYYALSAGVIQFMGAMGAIVGEAPVAHMTHYFGAIDTVNYIAFAGVSISVLFLVFIRNSPTDNKLISSRKSSEHILMPLLKVLRKPQNWATAFYGFCIWAPVSIFAALWAVPFFESTQHLSLTQAASVASFLWLGVAIGGPSFGMLSNHLNSRRIPLIFAAILGIFASLLIIYLPSLPIIISILLCFLLGFASSAQAVTFGLVNDNNHLYHMGTASGFNNMAIVFGGVIFQPIVGLILQWHNPGIGKIYSSSDYGFALAVIPCAS